MVIFGELVALVEMAALGELVDLVEMEVKIVLVCINEGILGLIGAY